MRVAIRYSCSEHFNYFPFIGKTKFVDALTQTASPYPNGSSFPRLNRDAVCERLLFITAFTYAFTIVLIFKVIINYIDQRLNPSFVIYSKIWEPVSLLLILLLALFMVSCQYMYRQNIVFVNFALLWFSFLTRNFSD